LGGMIFNAEVFLYR